MKIKIICAAPGMRRAGVTHAEKVKVWPADTFSADQIAQLRADPAFSVELVDDDQAIPVAGPDRPTVEGVLRLLLQGAPTDDLVADLTDAVVTALGLGTGNEAFRPVANQIFAQHAYAGDTNTEGAPTPPPADAGPSSDGPMQAGTGDAPDNAAPTTSGQTEVDGVTHGAEGTGKSGEASEEVAATSSEPTTSEPVSAPAKKARATKSTS
ncbi:hypothetical protein K9U40_10270 [Xanthobacter autotrophicus]|uniref:HI1506-related protein n=1 Tax=Xanthobacter TaxID=279 RepID=UPI0024AA4169|nr:HI1506-related protein [Xanthobacter autotrophicus]MDI4664710.1 hypothetical protein [Xanthobacter autotrophicus]